jgi:hypothetical protein
MNLVAEARALMALLQPLIGDRATGNALVNAVPGPTATLPGSSYAVPVIGGAARWDLLVKVVENPATTDGSWPVSTTTTIPVMANLGGPALNLPPGTVLRWFPTIEGIESTSLIDPAGLTGGTQLTGLTAVQQVAWFEELGAATGAEMLEKSLVTRFPSVVLAWESTGPRELVGRDRYLESQNWSYYIVTSRQTADPPRRLEGLMLVDAVRESIEGRMKVDGFGFSNNGVNVMACSLVTVTPQWYVYRVRFSTQTSSSRKETRTFNPWIRTRLDVLTPAPAPDGLAVVVDNEVLMPQ